MRDVDSLRLITFIDHNDGVRLILSGDSSSCELGRPAAWSVVHLEVSLMQLHVAHKRLARSDLSPTIPVCAPVIWNDTNNSTSNLLGRMISQIVDFKTAVTLNTKLAFSPTENVVTLKSGSSLKAFVYVKNAASNRQLLCYRPWLWQEAQLMMTNLLTFYIN